MPGISRGPDDDSLWVAPPTLPDEGTIETLREELARFPRVREAWVVGYRLHYPDALCEASSIGLLADPPWNTNDEFLVIADRLLASLGGADGSFHKLNGLTRPYWSRHAVKIYERGSAE